ncbi:hypothetical protein ABMA79_09040 [Halobacteriovorax sp. HFRX-2_2]|uniref:hypothetical protein n=1 Tax=unclassified Halobacteriovorax TaxID=2639665 RepID=UPI003714D942
MKFTRPVIDKYLIEIIPDFITNTVVDFKEFQSCYRVKDYNGMSRVCHRILGSAKSYGFDQLDEIVRELKKHVDSGDFEKTVEINEVFKSYVNFLLANFN